MASYDRWEILLAWLPSTDGTPPDHPHPCIYLGPSVKLPGGIKVLGITHDLAQRDQVFSVDMPWHPAKHPDTGLDKPSIAQAHWTPDISEEVICKPIGYTPIEQQRQLQIILALRSNAKQT